MNKTNTSNLFGNKPTNKTTTLFGTNSYKPKNDINYNLNQIIDNNYQNAISNKTVVKVIKSTLKEDESEEEDEKEDKVNENENIKKCSLDEHKELDAKIYCQECKINMCIKCEKVHLGLLKNHHVYSLDKNIKDIFTGLCTNKKHSLELEFYCKTHNELCCAACISKIKIKGKGQHKNCKVYYITKVKDNKKMNLANNFK